jgi:1-phosphofructokinase family hexose kinase
VSRVVVVTPNPAIDVTYRVAEQRIGETQRVLDVRRAPGGKGLNVHRVLGALGVPAISVLPLGGDAGRWIERASGALGLRIAAVPIAAETRTTVTVVDDHAHPTMFGEPGPVLDPAEWTAVGDAVREALLTASMLVVSGSLPRGADPDVVGDWVSAARAAGVPSVVDASGRALLAAAAAGADVLKPNAEELRDATGTDDERAGAAMLVAHGARAVVVSRGADGIAAHTRGGRTAVPAVPGVSGNPTGAGDAATAGLVAGLVRGLDLAACLPLAAAAGAAAVLTPVAGEIDLDAHARFLRGTPIGHGADA